MEYASRFLALLVLVAMTGVVRAETPAATTLSGKITKVTAKTIVLVDENKKSHTVRTDAKTKVMLDGKDATMSDLKAGQTVEVTPAKGIAASIDATSAADPAPPK